MKERFSFEGRQYVLAFEKTNLPFMKNSTMILSIRGGKTNPKNQSKIKNPTKLVRKIRHTVQQYLYRHKISYFEILVSDPKRSRIYQKLLKTLSGYQCVEHGYSFAVVKMKGDQ